MPATLQLEFLTILKLISALRKKSDNSLVAFVFVHYFGFSNNAYVIPERRGRGLVGVIMKYLTRKMVKFGMVPFGMILPDNISSLKSVSRAPGWFKTEYGIDVIFRMPAEHGKGKI